jgi:hypothetical protein
MMPLNALVEQQTIIPSRSNELEWLLIKNDTNQTFKNFSELVGLGPGISLNN